MLNIYPFTTLNQLTEFLGSVQNFVTVVGKWVFDRNILFVIPLTSDKLDYCCSNDDKTKGANGYKGILK